MSNQNYLVDNPTSEPIDNKYMAQDSVKPVDNSFPTINPEPFQPDVNNPTLEYGSYEPKASAFSDAGRAGVVRTQDQDLTFEQWEEKVLRQQKENFVNRTSIHMTPPSSSGAPFINEEKHNKKSSPEQLNKLKREQDISDMTTRLSLLQNNEIRLQKELEKNRQVQVVLRQRLDELNND